MKHRRPTVSRRSFLQGTAAVASVLSGGRCVAATGILAATAESLPVSPLTLHFDQPASKWPNALPVGNGRLGAVVFGLPGTERIQLNEESIWDGEPNRDRTNPRARAAIPRIRQMLFNGQIAEAEALAINDVLSIPRRMPMYQTLGDLHLDFTAMGLPPSPPPVSPSSTAQGQVPAGVSGYRLALDLDSAVATTVFTFNGVEYRREVFVSAPDQVIVIRLTASKAQSLRFRATLNRPNSFTTAAPGPGQLLMTGQALPVNDNPDLPDKEHQTGVRFHAALQVLAEGTGARTAVAPGATAALLVEGADAVTLLLDCATSYRYPATNGRDSGVNADVLTGDPAAMRAAVDRHLAEAALRPYPELRARHIADHQRLFRRVAFDLGPDPKADQPTDARVLAIKAGGDDPQLLPLYFQFGRYLLISSSRPGTLAANLQGIWNEDVDPPWGSKYTVNINAEMNYWFAEAANLSECHLPFFDLLTATRPQGTRTARAIYGARGSVVHHNTDLWGDAGPIDGLGGGVWPMGANWMSLHLWTHYAYTGDRRFLAEHTYPALRENTIFLLDYLVRDPHTGQLVTGPSCSPENAYELPDGKAYNLCMGPTMDISIVRAVFWRLLQAAAVLPALARQDAALLDRVRTAWAQLPPFKVGPDGRIQEWMEPYKDHEPGHRHISPLFGLFPEDQITVEGTPELAHASRVLLDRRLEAGGGSTGWSRSWIINCMARLGDGEACHANILELFRQSTRPNLFDVCGLKENSPFQIDGNLGAPNGLMEMLLQSHGETPLTPPAQLSPLQPAGPIPLRLLPALPKAWPQGSFRGLRVRGGLEVDCNWSGGLPVAATLHATLPGRFRIVVPSGVGTPMLQAGSPAEAVSRAADGRIILRVEAGKTYRLRFADPT